MSRDSSLYINTVHRKVTTELQINRVRHELSSWLSNGVNSGDGKSVMLRCFCLAVNPGMPHCLAATLFGCHITFSSTDLSKFL